MNESNLKTKTLSFCGVHVHDELNLESMVKQRYCGSSQFILANGLALASKASYKASSILNMCSIKFVNIEFLA